MLTKKYTAWSKSFHLNDNDVFGPAAKVYESLY